MSAKVTMYKVRLVKDRTITLPRVDVMCPEDAAEIFYVLLRRLPHEEMYSLLLGSQNNVVGVVKIGQGGADAIGLTPADVLRSAIVRGARGIILGHNHPGGGPASRDDLVFTRRLSSMCEVLGISMLDHLVVYPEQRKFQALVNGINEIADPTNAN